MASEQSTSTAGFGGLRHRRSRFAAWRAERPFMGGLLLLIAGVVIGYVPLQFAGELIFIGGSFTIIGLVFATFVFLCGAFALWMPEHSTVFGVAGVALALLSLMGALGGLFVGMLLGMVGGNLCVAWEPSDAATHEDTP